jgi:hypothetical protein
MSTVALMAFEGGWFSKSVEKLSVLPLPKPFPLGKGGRDFGRIGHIIVVVAFYSLVVARTAGCRNACWQLHKKYTAQHPKL